jgi:hypothetical protein
MQPFVIRATSQTNSVIALILCLCIIIPLGLFRNNLLPIPWNRGLFWSVLILLPIFALFYFIFRSLATSKTQWIITDSSIIVHWQTKSFIVKESDINISWANVESINKSVDPIYTTLIITLTNAEKIKFYFTNLNFGRDCDDLIIELNRYRIEKSDS